jgi:L-lysine 2,3-aminomutase
MRVLSTDQRETLYAAQKAFRQKKTQQRIDYLKDHPCIDCGESDPVVLDFDHIDPSQKTQTISRLMSGHRKWETILPEVRKCVVRCANCHRRRTRQQIDNNPLYGNRGQRSKGPVV